MPSKIENLDTTFGIDIYVKNSFSSEIQIQLDRLYFIGSPKAESNGTSLQSSVGKKLGPKSIVLS